MNQVISVVGGAVTGVLNEVGDADTFRLSVIPGETYRISFSEAPDTAPTFLVVFRGDDGGSPDAGQAYADTIVSTGATDRNGRLGAVFTAEQGVDYYVTVAGGFAGSPSFDDVRSFELTLETVADDAPDTAATTKSIVVGETETGVFEVRGDRDWVELDVASGASYLLSSDLGANELKVRAFDAVTGEEARPALTGIAAGFGAPQVGFSAEAGLVYFAEATSLANGANLDGTRDYALTLTTLPGDEASDPTTTLSLAAGGTANGAVAAVGDYDWIRLETTGGISYRYDSVLPSPTSFTFPQVRLIRMDDATGEITDVTEPGFKGAFTAEAGATYFLQPEATAAGLYSLTLSTYEDDAPDNVSTTISLGLEDPATVTLQAGALDVDFVRLDLAAGQSYRITGNVPFDIIAEDQIGATFGRVDYIDPRTDFSAFDFAQFTNTANVSPEAGKTYYLVAKSASGLDTAAMFQAEVVDDVADHAGTSATLAPNENLLGLIDTPSDQDWVRLDLDEGESYALRLTSGAVSNGLLTLFSVDGEGKVRLAEFAILDSSTGPVTVVTGRAGETLYAQIGRLESPTNVGTIVTAYTLSLTPIADDATDERLPAVNLAPDAVDDDFRTGEAAALSGALLLNDDATDGPALFVSAINGGAIGQTVTLASGATVRVAADGGFDYDPNGAFNALDAGETAEDSFVYTVSDGLGETDQATARIVIDGAGGAVPPVDPPTPPVEPPVVPVDPVPPTTDTPVGGTGGASRRADFLRGRDGADLINGLAGDDTLRGGGGGDTLKGGVGRDRLFGESGADRLEGGGGGDVLNGGGGRDRLLGQAGADRLTGGAGNDVLDGGGGKDNLAGGVGRDKLLGKAGVDRLNGGGGNDDVSGGGARDILKGGAGDDRLRGDAGNDMLEGGRGDDVNIGGAGRDTFAFRRGDGHDVIQGFQQGLDTIDIGRGANSFDDLEITQVGRLARIEFANVTIDVRGASAAAFDEDDFVF